MLLPIPVTSRKLLNNVHNIISHPLVYRRERFYRGLFVRSSGSSALSQHRVRRVHIDDYSTCCSVYRARRRRRWRAKRTSDQCSSRETHTHSTAPPATASNTIIMFWRISTRRAAPRLCSHFQLLIIALQYILTASLLCSFTAAQTRVERRASERASSSDRRWPASY